MLIVETIRKVRLSLAKGESQRRVAKKYRLSRKTVGKIASSGETEFKYTPRKEVHYPVLGSYIERLGEIMKEQVELPSKRRSTAKKIYESLQREGYIGGYDAVRRYIQTWKEEYRSRKDAYIPLQFGRGEAFHFPFCSGVIRLGFQVADVELRTGYEGEAFQGFLPTGVDYIIFHANTPYDRSSKANWVEPAHKKIRPGQTALIRRRTNQ